MSPPEQEQSDTDTMNVICPSCQQQTPIQLTNLGFQLAIQKDGGTDLLECEYCGCQFKAVVGETWYKIIPADK